MYVDRQPTTDGVCSARRAEGRLRSVITCEEQEILKLRGAKADRLAVTKCLRHSSIDLDNIQSCLLETR